jgi:hypothetical protein
VVPAANAGKKGKGKGTPNKGGGDGGGGGKKFEPVPFINVRSLALILLKGLFVTVDFFQDRLVIWDQLKQSYLDDLAAKTPAKIEITLPDGKVVEAESWRTSPYDVAKGIR